MVAFLPKCACENAARAPAAHLRWGAGAPQRGRVGGAGGGGHRISDITGGPRNPALTRVITGPNGPPDIYMISTSMPWVATAGNGWKRNVKSGVNGTDICSRTRTHPQARKKARAPISFVYLVLPGRDCMYACMWYALSRHSFGLV